jgi:hypothetical protein
MVALLPVLLLSIVVFLPGLQAGPSLDAAAFLVVGQRIAAGGVPYVDAWDHKMPGIYLVDALAAAQSWADPWLVAWIFSILATAATGVLVYAIVRARIGAGFGAAAAAACVLALGAYPLSLGGGMGETLGVLPATAALLVWSRRSASIGANLTVGILGGLAVVVSAQLAPAMLAIATWTLIQRQWRCAIAVIGGGAAVGIGLLVALGIAGAFGGFWDALIAYNAAYRSALADAPNKDTWASVQAALVVLAFLWVPALVGAFMVRDRLAAACLAWVLFAILAAVAQGRFYTHYAIAMVPPLVVLSADPAVYLLSGGPRNWRRVSVLVVFALLVPVISITGSRNGTDPVVEAQAILRRQVQVVGEELRLQAAPGDGLLVWGDEPDLYSASGLRPAIRYVYLLPLMTPGYATPALINSVASDLAASPPEWVVDAGSAGIGQPGKPPLLEPRRVIPADDGRDVDMLDPIRDFLRDNYELIGVAGDWPIYRLRD